MERIRGFKEFIREEGLPEPLIFTTDTFKDKFFVDKVPGKKLLQKRK